MNRQARPGYYILFSAYIDGETYTDAYCVDSCTALAVHVKPIAVAYKWIEKLVELLCVDDDHYSIAWCPSRNQAQKMACKNWTMTAV